MHAASASLRLFVFLHMNSAIAVACTHDHFRGFDLLHNREGHQYCLRLLSNTEAGSSANGRDKTRNMKKGQREKIKQNKERGTYNKRKEAKK